MPSKLTLRDLYEFIGPMLETYGDLPATLILHFGRGENIKVNPSDMALMARAAEGATGVGWAYN